MKIVHVFILYFYVLCKIDFAELLCEIYFMQYSVAYVINSYHM